MQLISDQPELDLSRSEIISKEHVSSFSLTECWCSLVDRSREKCQQHIHHQLLQKNRTQSSIALTSEFANSLVLKGLKLI